ncbi:RNA polymerase sigma factor [Aquiflexum gelatinilyticum]|uniref:Sigma-70 family RNA polymerase sigma factor n=1 Tax=Aquiflexum gelatinilyticum TaxID=2961943 RepID=A0A9X2SY56_9BACT|nr:sigma-70 family RNA polymerase sigma factor [Aquiflexum gelatinilyticum]MCR9014867.1 sigma-70 family RNA polymerase sigma factor [Aquiflexum gelatinilyticum]
MESDSKKSFVSLIQQNQGIVNSLCRLYATSNEEMKDYRQDVMLSLWKGFPKYREESKVSTWIYRVALNTLISIYRKKKQVLITEPFSESIESIHFQNSGSDDDLLVLQQAIGFLKPLEKALVILYLEGYDNKEIGKILSISESNVSTKLNRIKTQLKKTVKTLQNESR